MTRTVIVAAALAQKAGFGGHTWVILQYLLGLRRLGWDVLFLDRIDAGQCTDSSGRPCSVHDSVQAAYLARVMDGFGFGESYALIDGSASTIGMPTEAVAERVEAAELLLDVMGFLRGVDIAEAARFRVFLDIDPGFPQMWQALGLADVLSGYDAHATIGERIGEPDCPIPTCGIGWIPSRQPIALEEWPVSHVRGEAITTVASWRGRYGPIDYGGRRYGLRVHEFRRFISLPRLAARPFRIALEIDPADGEDLERLHENGWIVLDPGEVAGDPWAYREFVRGSAAELMIAKNMYVQARSGWFSDRSICYLAAGRPVIAQDTGIRELFPVDAGLLVFDDVEGAAAAVAAVGEDYARHAVAARDIAETSFDSDKVLSRLLAQLGVG